MPKESIKEQIYSSERILERRLKKIEDSTQLLKENKRTIFEFVSHARAKSLSPSRINIYLATLLIFGERAKKPFLDLDKRDLEAIFSDLNKQKYAAWTIETYKANIKYFFRWLYDLDSSDPLPAAVKWLKGTRPPQKIQREDLITEDEVKKLIDTTPHLMYKALISVLYESSCRPGEVLTLRIKDVFFNSNYVCLKVSGKMEAKQGKRDVYLFNSYDLIHQWMENHPFKENKDHGLWIVTQKNIQFGKVISLRFLNILLVKLAKRAGLKKRIYPYLFRHSRGTALYKKYGEALAKRMMGHSPDTRMARTYNHLNEEDVLERMKQEHGLGLKEEEKQTEHCVNCSHVNPLGAHICSKCKTVLREDTMLNVIDPTESITITKENIGKIAKMLAPRIKELLNK